MFRVTFLTLLIVVFAGCGPQDDPPPPAEETADASTVRLDLAVELPDTLQRAVEQWAAARRARVEWVDPTRVDGVTLAEIDATALVARARAGGLRPMPDDVAGGLHGGAAGQVDDRTWGVAWRGHLTVLACDRRPSWPDLARRGDAVTIVEDATLDAFLALAAASGAGPEPGTPHDLDPRSEAAVEALAFLRRLAVRARSTADSFAEGTTAAILDSRRRNALPAALRPYAFPGPEAEDDPRTLLRPRVLVVPADGDHGDLGVELARWLAAPARATLLHARAADGLALHRDVEGPAAVDAWLALRRVACLPPTTSEDAAAWNAALTDAVRAAVERRRSPEAALDEAWARR